MKVDVTKVWVDDTYVHILTSEGVERMEAIDNYERLRMATPEQLQNFETDNIGIHWPELDEDLSYEGFFKADAMEERSELYVLFKRFPQINVAGIARSLGIKQSLMAAYVCGTKKPSKARRDAIVNELHSLGRALLEIA